MNLLCKKCGDEKDSTAFYQHPNGKPKHPCRSCWRKYRRPVTQEQRRVGMLWFRYKIRPEQYDAMLAAQGGACAICRGDSKNGKRFAVDHDHSCCPSHRSCGKCVRGLLCYHCNQGLGLFGESVQALQAAIQYLSIYTEV